MSAIRLLIAEDDEVTAKNLRFTLEDMGYTIVGCATTGEELLHIAQIDKVDLAILDIDLPGRLDGIETASALQQSDIPYIFLTAQADTATLHRAKLTQPAAYLVKPFDEATLRSTIELSVYQHAVKSGRPAPKQIQTRYAPHESIFVKARTRLEKVRISEVLWVEASDIYSELNTRTGKFIVNYPLKVVEEKFPEELFLRVHRSFLVNLQSIDAVEDDELIINGKRIPIGKTYRSKLMEKLEIM
ncbi:MAG: response regulator [Cytophagales bacterium]|nr:response regulator [Bernardetiaceae bacterium]MDW8203523.1 response regulator [Cytophagales bacterium]